MTPILTHGDAITAVKRAWPSIVEECRSVLAGELHYQAMVYYCLRRFGNVPVRQLGMNVKMLIRNPSTDLFRSLDLKRKPAYQGAFEPIPDVVIFHPEVNADWRRRNREVTLRTMLLAIEVKASERSGGRLAWSEIADDIRKLSAHREEARIAGGDMRPIMMIVDTVPNPAERMRDDVLQRGLALCEREDVGLLYLSGENSVGYLT